MDRAAIERCARLALDAIHREYPYHLVHIVRGPEDVRPPRELTPAFWGSFDWHSAVHGHWCLVRALRFVDGEDFQRAARGALDRSFAREPIAGEALYLGAAGREGFERPYGLAWLLKLCEELRAWDDPGAARWCESLAPLEAIAVERLEPWFPRLPVPDRSGQHGQTAFAMGLMLDWARRARHVGFEHLLATRAHDFFLADRDAPIAYEPSGQDFLSPILAEADVMRRVLSREDFAAWLARFLPAPDHAAVTRWLTPVASPDRADGKLSHLDGLSLSRAWMMEAIAAALEPAAPWAGLLREAATRHRASGMQAVSGTHYAGAHWLGSFAVYLMSGSGRGDQGVA